LAATSGQDLVGGLLDAGPGCLDPLVASSLPPAQGGDVAEAVVVELDPDLATHDPGDRLGLQLGQWPVVVLTVEDCVPQFVDQGLHPLPLIVAGLDPDAVLGEVTSGVVVYDDHHVNLVSQF